MTTQQQQHVLYTGACDELHIPDQATNTRMQQIACEIYQDIWSYADHFLAILRILSLASTGGRKGGKGAETPIQQLKQLVAKGWTLDQGQHNTMQDGMSRMGLAICLTQLLSEKQLKAGKNDLTSHYAGYVYRLATLQHQYQPSSASEDTAGTTSMPRNWLTQYSSIQPTTVNTTYGKVTSTHFSNRPNMSTRKGTFRPNVARATSQVWLGKNKKFSQDKLQSCN